MLMVGQNCPSCSDILGGLAKRQNASDKFVEEANLIHNYKYDYSKSIYVLSDEKIDIICSKHGVFKQRPSSHLGGAGCNKCSNCVSYAETQWLNSFNIDIRNTTIKIEDKQILVDGYIPETNTIYEFYGDFWHGNPQKYNPEDINPLSKISFGELYRKTKDREALILSAGYNLITIWETDYKKIFVDYKKFILENKNETI
jgi:hypothetical protein